MSPITESKMVQWLRRLLMRDAVWRAVGITAFHGQFTAQRLAIWRSIAKGSQAAAALDGGGTEAIANVVDGGVETR